jgi:hypothetical protein
MIADDLTKALPHQWHEEFIRIIRLDDITEQIQLEKRMKTLRDKIKNTRADQPEMMFMMHQGKKKCGMLDFYIDIEI